MSSDKKDKYPFPNRNDDIYENIKIIEEFEFTHSIVYEFARRNENVSNILNFLNDLFAIYESIIYKTLDKYNKYYYQNNFKEDENTRKVEELINPLIKEEVLKVVEFHNQKELKNEVEELSIKNVEEIFHNIIRLLTDKLYNDYYIIYTTEFPSLFKNINKIYNPTSYLERDKTLTEIINNLNLFEHEYNINNNNFFNIFQIKNKYKKDIKLNIIYPKYKTAMRDFTDTNIAFNLNLPANELTDFIIKLKDDYDKKNSIIKSPLELFGEKLEIKVKDLDKKDKWADLLFMYDYYNVGIKNDKKKDDIVKEIQLIFTKIYGIKTFKKTLVKKIRGKSNEDETKEINQFEIITIDEYLNKYPEIDKFNLDFDDTADVKHYFSTKSIRDKYKQIKEYIEGDDPKYKTLICR